MLKLIDYMFFNIYRWYYKMKTDGRKVNPPSITSMILGLCIGGWCFLIIFLYFRFMSHKTFIPNLYTYILIFISLISVGLINEFYSSHERYLRIYNRYLLLGTNINKRGPIFLSFLLIFLPYLLIGAVEIIL